MILKKILLGLFFYFSTNFALACPDCETRQCIGPVCACVRDITKCTPDPVKDVINTVLGAVNGNIQILSQGVGGLVIKGSCFGCAIFAQQLNQGDRQFLETVIGRGFLVFLATNGSPTLVLVDAANSAPQEYALTHEPPTVALPQPPARPYRTFSTKASCALLADDKAQLVLAFIDPPTLQDSATNELFTFPSVDMRPNDVIVFTSGADCPKPPDGQQLLTSGKLSYANATVVPNGPTYLKYFMLGKSITR